MQPILTMNAENDSIHMISQPDYDSLGLSAIDVSTHICEKYFNLLYSTLMISITLLKVNTMI